ncbi:hypothetical protein HHK36_011435 [Tetracentron sinense]|uniref:NAC domain-containing protein n=1 Tax=Tetracentron sinense TaxID=13715 RepID=A0A835DH73_TETSI|nr:hypothetical protein HHK36_011435 [Tetracentron sinense]
MEDLAPGFRFYPIEEELISFYLLNKIEGKRQELDRVIPVVDIYEQDPWHLPQLSGERCRGDTEQWFFFTPRQEREARGGRPNRMTTSGYWKATGSPSYVFSSSNRIIGVKKTMVCEFSLCRVYLKSGCLRAFDRRPSASTTRVKPIHQAHSDGASTSQQNPPPVEMTTLPDSSFSGDNDNPPQIGESINWDMSYLLEPLWGWKELDWV